MKVQPTQLQDLIQQNQWELILNLIQESNPSDIASVLESLDPDLSLEVLRRLEMNLQAQIFAHFDRSYQLEIFKIWPNRDFAQIFKSLRSKDQADFYQSLDPEDQKDLLPYLDSKTRAELFHLVSYPPESAGGIMSTEFFCVHESTTIQDVMRKIKEETPRKKSLYYMYVVDDDMILKGVLTFRDLFLHDADKKVSEIMVTPVISALVSEDREQVVRKMEEYSLITLPVVNVKGQIVGIVEHDEAIKTLRAEETEDIQKFMGLTVLSGQEISYKHSSVWRLVRSRLPWIVFLAVMELLPGTVLHQSEKILDQFLILAIYLPLIMDAGGNIGSQSATLIIRALALHEVELRDWVYVLFKELRVGLIMGLTFGLLAFLRLYITSKPEMIPVGSSLIQIAMVVSGALLLQTTISALTGALLPLFVKALKFDPAVVANPLITTILDFTGVVIYMGLAHLILLKGAI